VLCHTENDPVGWWSYRSLHAQSVTRLTHHHRRQPPLVRSSYVVSGIVLELGPANSCTPHGIII